MRSNRVDRGCVLDSSVALAVSLEEPNGASAARFIATQALGRVRLVAPPLFDMECASGFVKAVRRGRLAAETCAAALVSTIQLPVERLQSPGAVFDALGLALRYGISAYDAVYVALAAEERLPLVTADARLLRALAGSPHAVLHLDDVEL